MGLLALAMISGCSTLSTVGDGSIRLLTYEVSSAVGIQFEDQRASPRKNTVDQEDAILFGDAAFNPTMPQYLERSVGIELAEHEWRAQAEDWLKSNQLSLVSFEASAGRRDARPGDAKRHAALASVHPVGPLLGMTMDAVVAEFARGKFVHVRAVLRSSNREFDASTLEPILDSNTALALQRATKAVSRMLAQDIAEEAVGLSQPR